MFKRFSTFYFLVMIGISAIGQDTILLTNPSFEENLRDENHNSLNQPPTGWIDCGIHMFPKSTPIDILPNRFWSKPNEIHDLETYIGMVVRQDSSYESIGQKLQSNLQVDSCYQIEYFVSRSDNYWSYVSNSKEKQNFITPAKVAFYAGNKVCAFEDYLGESPPINSSEWIQYKLEFKMPSDANYFFIVAEHIKFDSVAYNGHVLVDCLSAIVKIDCK